MYAFANYWMGHSLGTDNHYFSTDIELHRKKYREEAMPHLRIESAPRTETDEVIAKQVEEIERLKVKLACMQRRNGKADLADHRKQPSA